MMVGLILPVLVGAAGLGVEVSFWSVRQTEAQRGADAAALAATVAKNAGASDEVAAGAGADVAELNGFTGSATRVWNAGTSTLTNNWITMRKVVGVQDSSNTAFQAVIQQTVPLILAKLVTSQTDVVVSATATAEILPINVNGCMLVTGTAATALQINNNAVVSMSSCAARINGGVAVDNNAVVTTSGFMAAGTITQKNGGVINGPMRSGTATFTDPYASNATVQSAMTNAAAAGGSVLSGGGTKSPGSYTGMNFGNNTNVTLSPGLYLVHGDISFGNNVIIGGAGVTIVATGTVNFSNNVVATLSAPLVGAASGIPGMVLIGTSSATMNFNNNTSLTASGVIYNPNGMVYLANNFGNSAGTCSVVIANSVTLANNGYLANNCASNSGVPNFPVPVGSPIVKVVK